MLFFYLKGKNASQAANKICALYGVGAKDEGNVQKWFGRFKAGDFNLNVQECPGRTSTTNNHKIKTRIQNNLHSRTELAEMLKL